MLIEFSVANYRSFKEKVKREKRKEKREKRKEKRE